uniref:Mitochondrial ribosome associated GTPase 1 n=1 Tax=Anser brachyrhynchus TaxID=132585 RepID=A0A8B9CUL6_9AVES
MLQEALGIRPHVLVLNKMDLADPRQQPRVLEQLKQQGCLHVVFADCQRDNNVKKIVPLVAKLIDSSPRYHRAENAEYSIMVIGVPNVGKSSLINSLRRLHLRKGKATAVGGEPGVTKAVLTRIQVCETPLMYLVDTPGVLPPKLGDVETGMKLALCGAIRDHLVGEDIMADYLLYTLNRQQQFGYVQHYGLPEASDDIGHVLKHVALILGKTQKVKVLTGTGECRALYGPWVLGGCRAVDSAEGLHQPLAPSFTSSASFSRECQRDDAQLLSCCLRVPACLPCRTPGQGDAGLRDGVSVGSPRGAEISATARRRTLAAWGYD